MFIFNFCYHQVVAHEVPQHVITSMVYDRVPKWRTSDVSYRVLYICALALMFPITSFMYLLCPCSSIGKLATTPLTKFINGAASFVTLLGLLVFCNAFWVL